MSYQIRKLSGSTDGLGIVIAGTTSGTADTIHTAISGTSVEGYDLVTLFCHNSSANDVLITLEIGETGSTKVLKQNVIAETGRNLVLDGAYLQNAKVIKAFAAIANVLTITGITERSTTD